VTAGSGRRERQFVSLVCSNPEHLINLQQRFHQSGFSSYCTPSVTNLDVAAPEWATAVVVFPDELAEDHVDEFLRQLRRMRSRPVVVLVTSDERRLASRIDTDRRMLRPLILASPSSADEILSAIRSAR
jgi:hypothetical protein